MQKTNLIFLLFFACLLLYHHTCSAEQAKMVQIWKTNTNTELLSFSTKGPVVLLQLPKGTYLMSVDTIKRENYYRVEKIEFSNSSATHKNNAENSLRYVGYVSKDAVTTVMDEQILKNIVKEVERRKSMKGYATSASAFPEAGLFMSLCNKANPEPELQNIHIAWLINAYSDIQLQISKIDASVTSVDPEKIFIKEELLKKKHDLTLQMEKIIKELGDLSKHPKVGETQKEIIGQFFTNKDSGKIGKPDPEIYFLHGNIWKKYNHASEALVDYLSGIECVMRDSSRSITDYRFYIGNVILALESSQKAPDPKNVTKNNTEAAKIHFAHGYSAFWAGRYNDAIIHFSDAIAEDDTVPTYWYYRAITWKRLGANNQADFDAYHGTVVEHQLFGKKIPVVGVMFRRLQGEDRIWLENKRIGYK